MNKGAYFSFASPPALWCVAVMCLAFIATPIVAQVGVPASPGEAGATLPGQPSPRPPVKDLGGSFENLVAVEVDRVVRFDPPRFDLFRYPGGAFVFYENGRLEEVKCERSVNLGLMVGEGVAGDIRIGVCTGADATRLQNLAAAAPLAASAAIEIVKSGLKEGRDTFDGPAWRHQRNAGPDGSEIHSFPVIWIGHGFGVIFSAVLVARDGQQAIVVQGHVDRMCGGQEPLQTPLCANPVAAISEIAQRLHTRLREAPRMLAASGKTASPQGIDWHDRDSYSGWVTDAATGKPIEGTVVVAVWQIQRRPQLFNIEGGPDHQIIRLEETLTDKDGRFQFAPLGDYTPPLGWIRDEVAFPLLRFFKPGYVPTGHTRFTWEFGEYEHLLPKGGPAITPRKEGWQREVQLYRYLTQPVSEARAMNPIYKRLTDEQKILEPLTGFASFLDNNVRNSGGSLGQRKAIEAQWRAIVIVDEEIRKYRPKHESFGSAIRDALQEKRKKEGIR